MIFFHVLITLLCGAICFHAVRDIRLYFPRFLMFGGLGLIHGLVPLITPAALHSKEFLPSSRDEAALFAFISILMLAFGWFFADSVMHRRPVPLDDLVSVIESPRGQKLYRRLFWISLIAGTCGWILYFWSAGASLASLIMATRFEYRSAGDTPLKVLGIHLVSLTFMPGFLCFFLPKNYRIIGIFYAVTLAVLSFTILAVGTRSISLAMIGAFGVAYILRTKVSPGSFFAIVGVSVSLFILAVSLYEVRKVMSNQSVSEVASLVLDANTYQNALVSDPLNYHEHTVGAIESFPRKHPFLEGATYRRILFFLIPNSVIPGLKPEDTNMVFANVVYNKNPALMVTVPPSIPGDAYINFWGWPGVFVLFFEGMFFAWISYLMQTNLLWFSAFGPQFARFTFLAPRGQPYDLFVMIAFVLIATSVLMRLCGYSFRTAQRDIARRTRVRLKTRNDLII